MSKRLVCTLYMTCDGHCGKEKMAWSWSTENLWKTLKNHIKWCGWKYYKKKWFCPDCYKILQEELNFTRRIKGKK